MNENFVVVSTVHPVAGHLYLEMIDDSSVGMPNTYLVTDEINHANVHKVGWRAELDKVGYAEPYSELLINKHLTSVDWGSVDMLQLAKRHGVLAFDLYQWCSTVLRWQDLPVNAEYDEILSEWTTVSANTAMEG
ncbi:MULTISPECIES: hypothetical protein [Lonsdalea]|uniref:Uncharacterized protein n=2 Tax=Lonsdalea TaxID=1082702 RepID=A0ACD1J8N0_9GAMM|nr:MULTISPECIES: hypothetical protein [Lonsdalea]RAT10782.1 hypothetical protein AU485_15840 [Lonsdalea quercina]RAT19078.1 hypothetical protein AU487_12520 [Lonsdalea populi]RAT20379.1 hypothetical protein AU489_16280 [Lonsdalea populi]RAT23492.1 hypothetical protein AU488_09650 [Lonsdalea populi]RAT32552.1 hypothetical protein AU492_12585 [Lonsdalea populi]